MTRAAAKRLLEAKGATYQSKVTPTTTLVVAGQPNPLQIVERYRTTLFDAVRRTRLGQKISIVDANASSTSPGRLCADCPGRAGRRIARPGFIPPEDRVVQATPPEVLDSPSAARRARSGGPAGVWASCGAL
jgi:hypothetical protein